MKQEGECWDSRSWDSPTQVGATSRGCSSVGPGSACCPAVPDVPHVPTAVPTVPALPNHPHQPYQPYQPYYLFQLCQLCPPCQLCQGQARQLLLSQPGAATSQIRQLPLLASGRTYRPGCKKVGNSIIFNTISKGKTIWLRGCIPPNGRLAFVLLL